jgi:hypothetical protein
MISAVKKKTGSGLRLQNLQGPHSVTAFFSKIPPRKSYSIFQKSTPTWREKNVRTHEPMGDLHIYTITMTHGEWKMEKGRMNLKR